MSIYMKHYPATPDDPYSSGDGSDPMTADAVALDGTGGTVTTDYFIAYLFADSDYYGVELEIVNEETGVDWQFSYNAGATWVDYVYVGDWLTNPPTVLNNSLALRFRAVVDNDGSVSTGIKTGCKVRISYT